MPPTQFLQLGSEAFREDIALLQTNVVMENHHVFADKYDQNGWLSTAMLFFARG